LADAFRKARLGRAGDRFLDFMVDRGHKLDFWLERVPPLAGQIGLFWQAKAIRRPG
jgi:hypothetical protein